MSATLLVLNAGSATLKFEFFGLGGAEPRPLARGLIDGIGKASARLTLHAADGGHALFEDALVAGEHHHALQAVFDCAARHDWQLAAVAHRVVHGGTRFHGATRLDAEAIADLRALVPLAPLHQPVSLAAIDTIAELAPAIPQIACFDTAFHATQDPLATRFGIASHWHDDGVRRYSFHGLSYAAIARQLPAVLGQEEADKRVVVLHLGSGSSACALYRRRSVATSMGFSAVEGLMMGTRPGNLDPEVVLYWQEHEGMSVAEVRAELYKRSGLLGVSGGISADMRELLASDAPAAATAVDLYCYRAAREVGALAVQAGGLDHIVFTAGIGEKSAAVREKILTRLAWLGFAIEPDANTRNAPRISRDTSLGHAWVIRTDEEGQMAREAAALL